MQCRAFRGYDPAHSRSCPLSSGVRKNLVRAESKLGSWGQRCGLRVSPWGELLQLMAWEMSRVRGSPHGDGDDWTLARESPPGYCMSHWPKSPCELDVVMPASNPSTGEANVGGFQDSLEVSSGW